MAGIPGMQSRLNPEFWAIIASAIALGGLVYFLLGDLPKDVGDLRERITRIETLMEGVGDLPEHITRIETLMEAYIRGEPPPPRRPSTQ